MLLTIRFAETHVILNFLTFRSPQETLDVHQRRPLCIRFLRTLACSLILFCLPTLLDSSQVALRPGTRVLLDAHNCYPYYEWWFDRIDRALSAGTPLAIEQDLLWAKNPRTGAISSVVSHGGTY